MRWSYLLWWSLLREPWPSALLLRTLSKMLVLPFLIATVILWQSGGTLVYNMSDSSAEKRLCYVRHVRTSCMFAPYQHWVQWFRLRRMQNKHNDIHRNLCATRVVWTLPRPGEKATWERTQHSDWLPLLHYWACALDLNSSNCRKMADWQPKWPSERFFFPEWKEHSYVTNSTRKDISGL